jgi:hypothetical protein
MKLLERRLTLYEEKYGVLSEDFYAALVAGELAHYDAFDETRTDFSRWKATSTGRLLEALSSVNGISATQKSPGRTVIVQPLVFWRVAV